MQKNHSPMAIELHEVSKHYGATLAVNQVSISIAEGESVALLGPNGAGKTTLLDMIQGLSKPNHGQVFVFGQSWGEHPNILRQLIGISLQSTAYLDYVTILELATLFAKIHQIPTPQIHRVFERVDLTNLLNRRFNQLSGGQQQRFSIAMAILHQPKLILLDEPSTGLDPNARHDLWNLIKGLQNDGMTLLLTTHYMEEATTLCRRIILMNQGEVVADGSINELILASKISQCIEVEFQEPITTMQLESLPYKAKIHENGYKMSLDTHESTRISDVARTLSHANIGFTSIRMQTPNLEDIFRHYTGRTLS